MAQETGMSLTARFRETRRSAYRYRSQADLKRKVALAGGMAALTGVLAQVRIALSFTPVPITGQTFAVLLAGVVLGARWGGISQGIYVGGGLAGIPWFKEFGSGLGHLLGPTGGYIIGFLLAAVAIGYAIDRVPRTRRLPHLFVLLFLANFGIIYAIGLPWLGAWLGIAGGTNIGVVKTLHLGLVPFVPGDVLKVVAATAVARLVLPADTG